VKKVCDDVEAFHRACDIPVLDKPAVPSEDIIDLRMDLLLEEFVDAASALGYAVGTDNRTGKLRAVKYHDIGEQNIQYIAKEFADIVCVVVGAALEFGIPFSDVWDMVHESNMAKKDPITGEVRRRDDGKVIKPDGWEYPDVGEAIWGRPSNG
jgi:predicted HAD superfamily Cof-like phosphohydrolase